MSLRRLFGFSPDNEASFAAAAKCAQRDRPRVHNYKDKEWGHDLVFRPEDNGLRADISGWGSGLKAGDFILMADREKGPQGTTRYRITTIKYHSNPPDMWSGQAEFARRSIEQMAVDEAHLARHEQYWDELV